jgi:capsular polysaccharide biosynthesis protein
MLSQLIEDGGSSRALFLSTSPVDFLISVFRGGSERVQYTYAVLKHLLTAFPEFTKIVAEVEAEKLTSPDMFARLSLIVHAIQCKAFERVSSNLRLTGQYHCSYQEMLNSPAECMQQVATALELDFDNNQLDQSINKNFTNHSKVTKRSFDTNEAQKVDQQVLAVYDDTFARTFDWAERSFIRANFF